MRVDDLKALNCIIFECITGSRAYGLALPHSDTDIKGVFVLPKDKFYGMEYVAQVNNETNDIVYYELGRFIELLTKNNPNLLEMLNVSEEHILYKNPVFDKLHPELFLSKISADTFVNYADAQIKKAKGLNKKIVNPMEPERKTPLNFCHITYEQGSIPLLKWLEIKGYVQENCGLVNIPYIKDLYALFYDEHSNLNYEGVISGPNANEVILSSIPKGQKPLSYLFFSKDSYAQHCKQYREYWDWVDKRNEERYANTQSHGKNYDSKNMMHTFRLLDMAEDLLRSGKIVVQRPNREELLKIRAGEFEYAELVERAAAKVALIQTLKGQSDLPDAPDLEKIDRLLVEMREVFYHVS